MVQIHEEVHQARWDMKNTWGEAHCGFSDDECSGRLEAEKRAKSMRSY